MPTALFDRLLFVLFVCLDFDETNVESTNKEPVALKQAARTVDAKGYSAWPSDHLS